MNKKTIAKGREDYFLWPSNWKLQLCPVCGSEKESVREPVNKGNKDPREVEALIVGLNPGRTELENHQYFVGSAGRFLRGKGYDVFWEAVGDPKKSLVTNMVKVFTPDAATLKKNTKVGKCARDCFLDELEQLPKVNRIYLLGSDAASIFEEFCEPEITANPKRFKHRTLEIYKVRHPSYSWQEKNLPGKLKEGVSKPWKVVKLE